MLTRTQKEEAVASLRDRMDRATSVFLADYRGLSVPDLNELRGKLRAAEDEYEYFVAKNTLLRRAVTGSDAEPLADHLTGPTAVAFAYGEPVALAKLLVDYAKGHEAFEIKGGLVDGRSVDRSEIARLATLPSLLQLRSTIVGLLQAPAQKIAAVVAAPASQLARVVEARRAKLEVSDGGS